ncbi:MAG: thioredoxin-disulfide reductase [Alphaproteobacteria bacterium TMED89]|nr:thioredoxin-disulfide reductase [Rhodospirillaceae bacterium]RPH15249.1 MAG: thioredoxin-disulfide reductase [Alphaproteobacteria bacterium TMED89]
MTETNHRRMIILGSGPAGYTAAVYAARAALNPMLLQGMQPGGQLSITTDVENYPGFAEAIQGPWLMDQMKAQAESVGTEMVFDHVASVDLEQRPFTLHCESGTSWTCDTLVICTGAQAKWLGLDSEDEFRGFGVSACATCDGFFFRDREVAVVGGGNTAVEEALYLTNHASKVYLIHRRDALRCEKILENRLLSNPKIETIWDTEVQTVNGTAGFPKEVTGLTLHNRKTGALSELKIDGLFVAIGHEPATGIFKDAGLDMDGGYLVTAADSTKTNIPGVFAAGDVTDHIYRQAVTAAGMGCMAALEVEKYLAALDVGETPDWKAAA